MDYAEMISHFLGEAARAQVLQYGFFFSLAALIHAKQVRKEIAMQFGMLNTSIDNLSKALTSHASRLDTVEEDVKIIKRTLKV